MKKYLALIALLGVSSCSAPVDPAADATPVAQTYFIPQTNGLQFTYSHDDQNTSDTSTYQVVVLGGVGEPSRLAKLQNGIADLNDLLYYYQTRPNPRDGIFECLMTKQSGSGETIIALRGELYVGNSWIANADSTIIATVEDHYEFYYLVGREKRYEDVVLVKYIDSREPEGTYTLRFFANGYGLIHEKKVVTDDSDPTTQISNLRLIKSTVNGNTISQQRNRWWEAKGRYTIEPVRSEDID
jgi:hypothetical protein